jgi:hypothetical protein
MADVIYIPDHRELAVARLLSQFREKPRMRALVRALAAGAQSLEDESFGVLISTTFTAASDHDLDVWGVLLDEPRGDLSEDDDYRAVLRAKAIANRSTGSTPDLVAVFEVVAQPGETGLIRYRETFPLSFTFEVIHDDALSDSAAARVGRILREIKPAGIAMSLTEATSGFYGFVDDPAHPGGVRSQDPAPLGLDRGKLARNL